MNTQQNQLLTNNQNSSTIPMEIGQSSSAQKLITPHVIHHIHIPTDSSGFTTQPMNEHTQSSQKNYNTSAQQEQDQEQQDPRKRPGFFVYPEKVINNGVNACQRSVLGRIITEKTIHTSSIQNGLESIWGSPIGLRIQEIDGGILQFFMDRKFDQERILLGNPWVFRNSWLIVKPWDRQTDPRHIDFSHAPVWIQMWGLPPHCKTKEMGESLGNLLGTVETAELYEYSGKKLIVKVKVAINVYKPIQAGILIGNHRDGTHWIDYRYENLPQVCFNCRLVGHEEKLCMNETLIIEGQAPLGPWIRSNQYGRRIRSEQDKQFHSNPSKGKNFGHYSPPIPASMLAQMAAMKLQEEAEENQQRQQECAPETGNRQGHRKFQVQKAIVSRTSTVLVQEEGQGTTVVTNKGGSQVAVKRPRLELEASTSYDTIMAGPAMQASQGQ
jgi:hypothetical protein